MSGLVVGLVGEGCPCESKAAAMNMAGLGTVEE